MKYKSLSVLSLLMVLATACSKDAVKIPKEVRLDVSDIVATVDIHSSDQKSFLESADPVTYIDNNISDFGHSSNSAPSPVTFFWEEANDLNQKANKYVLSISENVDMSDSLEYSTKKLSFDVFNLKLKTRYYYQIKSIHSGKSFLSSIKEFTIDSYAPRNIYVDGVENVRDLGGWNIGENKIFKQGMIYRTSQFNYGGVNTFVSSPSKEGKNSLLNELKIKTDIDLRRNSDFDGYDEVNGITSSPLGKNVKYVSAPMQYGNSNIFTSSRNKNSIKTFFNTLANEDNYPVAFHCVRGTDRTGALAYVIGALVGMSSEDLIKDYLFSDFANIGDPVRYSTISGEDFYVQGIANSEGANLSEKTKNYLHNTVGVEISTLEAIKDILVEEMTY